ncbi:hypothetical protein PR048_008022 [Dryococelus australis]|uniref:Uncharacterized protein n=1 Tax=Dryococelus australis TaxID=614101 RepID=A0ABQ9HWR3_9NEOP|nr:hypothetical protein PR048_008022 [Dryococelus australis]
MVAHGCKHFAAPQSSTNRVQGRLFRDNELHVRCRVPKSIVQLAAKSVERSCPHRLHIQASRICSLGAAAYIQFLQDVLPEYLEEVTLDAREAMWFQQDGVPPHFATEVRRHLGMHFPNPWLGRGGPTTWLPRLWHSASSASVLLRSCFDAWGRDVPEKGRSRQANNERGSAPPTPARYIGGVSQDLLLAVTRASKVVSNVTITTSVYPRYNLLANCMRLVGGQVCAGNHLQRTTRITLQMQTNGDKRHVVYWGMVQINEAKRSFIDQTGG